MHKDALTDVPEYFRKQPNIKGVNMRLEFYSYPYGNGETTYVDRTFYGYDDEHLHSNIRFYIGKYGIIKAYILQPKEQQHGTESQETSTEQTPQSTEEKE